MDIEMYDDGYDKTTQMYKQDMKANLQSGLVILYGYKSLTPVPLPTPTLPTKHLVERNSI